jgi:hypothetical protein
MSDADNYTRIIETIEYAPEVRVQIRKAFAFKPRSDITAYEMAEIMSRLDVNFYGNAFDELPNELKRHFKEV